MNKKPQAEVLVDEYQAEGEKLTKDYFEDKTRTKFNLLQKAIENYRKTSYKDGKMISRLLQGTYYFEKAKQEKNHKKACALALKAEKEFKSLGKEAKDMPLQARAYFLKRKIDRYAPNKLKADPKLFKQLAETHKKLGQEDNAAVEMTMFYMESLIMLIRNKRPFDELDVALESMRKSVHQIKGRTKIKAKFMGLYHNTKSKISNNPEEAKSELSKAIESINKTDDKYGLELAQAELLYVSAISEKDPTKKNDFIKQSIPYFRKAGLEKVAYDFEAKLLAKKVEKRGLESKVGDYLKVAELYKKAGLIRMEKLYEGHHYAQKATVEGVLKDNNKLFKDNLMKANHLYAQAGNLKGVEFTAGIGIFLEAINIDDNDKKIKALELSAQSLMRVGEVFLGSMALAEKYRLLKYEEKDKDKLLCLVLEEKNNLERHVIEGKKKKAIEIPFSGERIDTKLFTALSEAELAELNAEAAFLEENHDKFLVETKTAIELFRKLENSDLQDTPLEKSIITSLAWNYIYVHDYKLSKYYLNKLIEINPKSGHIPRLKKIHKKFIKVKSESVSKIWESRISVALNPEEWLSKDDLNFSVTPFFDLCRVLMTQYSKQMESKKYRYQKDDEEKLRDILVSFVNPVLNQILGVQITGESFHAHGKTDFFSHSPKSVDDKYIGEAKIWKGEKYFLEGYEQLNDRQVTEKQRGAVYWVWVKTKKLHLVYQEVSKVLHKNRKKLDITRVIDDSPSEYVIVEKDNGQLIYIYFVDLIESITLPKKSTKRVSDNKRS